MITKLTGQEMKPTPVVGIAQKLNGVFTGVLLDKGHERKMKKGKKFVYRFKVVSGDMPISVRDGEGFKDVDVKAGDEVSVFAGTVLHKAFQKAEIGMALKMTYLGIPVGKEYHNFDVEVV